MGEGSTARPGLAAARPPAPFPLGRILGGLPLNLRSEGGSRTRICSCFAMAPEADAIGDSAERGRARGGGSLAGAWGVGRTTVAARARRSSRTGPGSRVPKLRACCSAAGSGGLLSGQQLRVSQLTQPHTSRRGHAHCDPRLPT